MLESVSPRILCIEDDLTLALIIQQRLKQYSYPVELAHSGQEGLQKLQKQTFDLIILDYHLPDNNGLEILRNLNQTNTLQPIIMMTGLGNEKIAVEAMKQGIAEYLVKDLEGNYLKLLPTIIKHALDQHRIHLAKQRAEQALYYREKILEIISTTAEKLLIATNGWEQPIQFILQQLGKISEVSRVYIYENKKTDQQLQATLRHEWTQTPIPSLQQINFQHIQYLPTWQRWIELLSQGDIVNLRPAELNPREKTELSPLNLLASIRIPIFVDTFWWGFIGFDDCQRERHWLAVEIEALRMAANILGAAIQRQYTIRDNQLKSDILRGERDFMNTVLENSPVGISLINHRGEFVRLNRRMLDIFGYQETEMLAKNMVLLYKSPEGSKKSSEIYERLDQGEICETELWMTHHNGEKICCRWLGKAIDSQDLHKGYVWIVEDITTQKHTEQTLRLAAAVFAASSEGIIVTDANNKIILTNRAFTEITGYSESEVKGHNPSKISSGRHDAQFFNDMWNELLEKGKWQGEIWNRRKNNETYPAWLSIATVRGTNQKITCYIALFADITERKRSDEIIYHQANYDALTDLPNRSLFMERINNELELAIQDNSLLFLLFIDLDRFKTANDTYGHSAGNELLQQVAQRLLSCVRVTDTVARMGGDEFAAILPRAENINIARTIAENILESLTRVFIIQQCHRVYISCSIGIACFPQDGKDTETLLKHADNAMYHAKDNGRSNIQFFTPELSLRLATQMRIENELHQAIESNNLLLHYQPVINLNSGYLVAVEALLRWQRKPNELLFPDDFIQFAEQSGLIIPIGIWVIQTALQHFRHWYKPQLHLSLNISLQQFKSNQTLKSLKTAIEINKIPPNALIIEVKENALLANPDEHFKILKDLKELGILLALDDFGTGYSSLNYLRKLPLDFLKIDQSFIQNAMQDKYNARLFNTITELAHELNVQVIGEGVETEKQLNYLQHEQIDWAQGKFFHPPIIAPEFENLLEHRWKINKKANSN